MLFNAYPSYKEKLKDKLINSYRYEFIMNSNVQMFDHKFNTTADIKIDRFMIDSIEFKLNIFGIVGFFIYENRLMCEPINFIGDRNNYGLPRDAYVIINNNMGKQIHFSNWLENDDLIIMKNNKLGTTDNDLGRVSNYQSEIEKSYLCNIINSRLSPIIKVNNPKDKKKVEDIIKNIYDGKPQTIDLTPSLMDDEETMQLHNITNVEDSSKIQYLDLAKESITKRYYQENGINLNSSVKQAQQSIAEITDGSNSAFIYPSNKLQARTDCVEEFKEKFNIAYNVEFTTCWLQQWKMLNKSDEELEKEDKDNDLPSKRPTDKSESTDNNSGSDSGDNE